MQPAHKVILNQTELLETLDTQAIIISKTFSLLPQILEFINSEKVTKVKKNTTKTNDNISSFVMLYPDTPAQSMLLSTFFRLEGYF